jgi:gluconate 2-dehydrogenase gamma chain
VADELPTADPTPPPVGGHGSWVDRRTLLKTAAGGAAAATVAGFWFEGFGDPRRRQRVEPTPAGAPGLTFDPQQWALLEAALDRLLPSEPDAPGARDVNAIGYLDRVLQEPDLEPARYMDVIRGGLGILDAHAEKRGAARFTALDGAGQDAVLHALEAEAGGVLWIKRVLYFALEALLGDPVHGCQPGEVGWKWLGNAPGEPRPTSGGRRPRRG